MECANTTEIMFVVVVQIHMNRFTRRLHVKVPFEPRIKVEFEEYKVIQKKSLSNHSFEFVVSNPYNLSFGTVCEMKSKKILLLSLCSNKVKNPGLAKIGIKLCASSANYRHHLEQ